MISITLHILFVKTEIKARQKVAEKVLTFRHIHFSYSLFCAFEGLCEFSVACLFFLYTFDKSRNFICRLYDFP